MSVKTFVAVVGAATVAQVSAYSSYSALIPNGDNIGMTLGHPDSDSSQVTDFGTLFSGAGTEWSAVCSETWPGGSVTCGQALGDPCCTWSSGDADYSVTSMPGTDTEGYTCATASTSTASSAAAATSTAASSTGSATTEAATTTASSNATASATSDESEDGSYCE